MTKEEREFFDKRRKKLESENRIFRIEFCDGQNWVLASPPQGSIFLTTLENLSLEEVELIWKAFEKLTPSKQEGYRYTSTLPDGTGFLRHEAISVPPSTQPTNRKVRKSERQKVRNRKGQNERNKKKPLSSM